MPEGDCYEVHVRFLRESVDVDELDGWTLCHGIVTNAAGQSFGHCWLERDGNAYDLSNGNRFELAADQFRELVGARDVTAYTSEEVSVNTIRHGHLGPWP